MLPYQYIFCLKIKKIVILLQINTEHLILPRVKPVNFFLLKKILNNKHFNLPCGLAGIETNTYKKHSKILMRA